MEYSFRYSARDVLRNLILDDYGLVISAKDQKEAIPYARIISVRITRSSPSLFKLYVYPDDHDPIVIPSRSVSDNGKDEDQSRAYVMLVRVLHRHLKEKSTAEFASGVNASKMWQWATFSAIFWFTISIAFDYLGFRLMNPYLQALTLTTLSVGLIWAFCLNKLPKTYDPADIPLQFLP